MHSSTTGATSSHRTISSQPDGSSSLQQQQQQQSASSSSTTLAPTRQYGRFYLVRHGWGLVAIAFIGACYLYNFWAFFYTLAVPLQDDHPTFVSISTAVFVTLFSLTIYCWLRAILTDPGNPRCHSYSQRLHLSVHIRFASKKMIAEVTASFI